MVPCVVEEWEASREAPEVDVEEAVGCDADEADDGGACGGLGVLDVDVFGIGAVSFVDDDDDGDDDDDDDDDGGDVVSAAGFAFFPVKCPSPVLLRASFSLAFSFSSSTSLILD